MANAATVIGDMHVAGALSCVTLSVPSQTILNTHVNANANISATKVQQQYCKTLSLEGAASIATGTSNYVMHVVNGVTGSLVRMSVGQSTLPTNDITIQLLKGTETVSVVTLTSTHTANSAVISTTTASLSQNDVLTLRFYPSSTTTELGSGFFAQIVVREDAE